MYAIGDGFEKNPQEAEKYKRLAKKYSGQEIKIWKIKLKYSLLYASFSTYVSLFCTWCNFLFFFVLYSLI